MRLGLTIGIFVSLFSTFIGVYFAVNAALLNSSGNTLGVQLAIVATLAGLAQATIAIVFHLTNTNNINT